jgi:hypothetical protein
MMLLLPVAQRVLAIPMKRFDRITVDCNHDNILTLPHVSVVAAGFASGCHSAAAIRNPSIALIDRNRSPTPGSGCISSGSPPGRGVKVVDVDDQSSVAEVVSGTGFKVNDPVKTVSK